MLKSVDSIVMPATHMPNFRTSLAIERGVERNLLFRTWGGLGDQICAEPTLRYALKVFKDCEISLASECPELFSHLNFKRVFDLKKERPIYEDYLSFETITPPDESNLVWLFFSHMTTHCVDFPSMCALRSQLPNADKELYLVGKKPPLGIAYNLGTQLNRSVVIHPGRHWPSKTFPKSFWDKVANYVIGQGLTPVLIGADTDDNRGTVGVEAEGCVDLRNKLSVPETIWLLQNTKALLTNDSSPLHMAAAGRGWIGFVATCKHPDLITHWREGQFGWRMKNFGRGGIWDVVNYCPNKSEKVTVDQVDPDLLKSWLPDPYDFAAWACDKVSKPLD